MKQITSYQLLKIYNEIKDYVKKDKGYFEVNYIVDFFLNMYNEDTIFDFIELMIEKGKDYDAIKDLIYKVYNIEVI